ncbi:uncharacterized protein LOC114952674 [Acropora millepora]|uniref:uncharacterized protein LOC114952674 n=1 Tax=Acropora millepora TaxID=45264 RepID=UPI001CF0E570|nr:uncharacterized protein LOC114952674 [Acropora millepora]
MSAYDNNISSPFTKLTKACFSIQPQDASARPASQKKRSPGEVSGCNVKVTTNLCQSTCPRKQNIDANNSSDDTVSKIFQGGTAPVAISEEFLWSHNKPRPAISRTC